jgi:DNA polymerase-3 subunit delta
MIIFLYGEDSFRSSRKVAEIKNKFMLSDKSGSGLSVFDFDDGSDIFSKIKNVSCTANLLSPKRLLIVRNLIAASLEQEQKLTLDFLKSGKQKLIENEDLVIIFWEGNQPKKSNAVYKFLEKNVKKQNFEKLVGIKLEAWVLKTVKEIDPNAQISKVALSKLIAYCAGDNFLMFQEIQKLVSYAGEEMISEKDVDILVKANLDSNIFATVDALGANNKKIALKLLYEHLEKGDDPFYILSMFFYQFRNMLKVSDLYEQGIRSEYEISRITKLHSFVVRKSLSQIRNFSFDRLKEIYQKLSALDALIKTGKIDIKLALDKFVVEL